MISDRFTNQKRRIATEEDVKARWGGDPPGARFVCNLCGHKFRPGDGWRFVFGRKTGNFFTCDECDGLDVLDRADVQFAEAVKLARRWGIHYE